MGKRAVWICRGRGGRRPEASIVAQARAIPDATGQGSCGAPALRLPSHRRAGADQTGGYSNFEVATWGPGKGVIFVTW
jgi:hypothetical protein